MGLRKNRAQVAPWASIYKETLTVMNNYIKISAAAKDAGVTITTLKSWEALFGWQIHRNEQGHRLYSEEDISKIKAVKKHRDEHGHLRDLVKSGQPKYESGHSGHAVHPSYTPPRRELATIEY